MWNHDYKILASNKEKHYQGNMLKKCYFREDEKKAKKMPVRKFYRRKKYQA